MIKFFKYLAYILAFILMASSIIFIPEIADSLSPTYILLVCSFLGIDMAFMLKKTNSLPEGQFAEIKRGRYFFCIIISGLLFILSVFVTKKFNYSINGTLTSLGISLMTILGMFIGGAEANRFLTSSGSYLAKAMDKSFNENQEKLFEDKVPEKEIEEDGNV